MTVVALLGVGLMGGSIGLALRQGKSGVRVRAYARRAETREAALNQGVADEVFADPAEAVRGADLVIACVPVRAIPPLVEAAKPGLAPGCVVTDVGSTKAWLAVEMKRTLAESEAVFIGSHPMCGSEKTGLEAASPELYRNAVCVVCSDPETRAHAWNVTRFWASLGGRVVEMDAETHDRRAAATSHVPHLAATATVLATEGDPAALRDLIGTGFRDVTRVAAGSPSVWRDIVESNRDPVLRGLQQLQSAVGELARLLETGDMDALEAQLRLGAERRGLLCHPAGQSAEAPRVVAIDGPSASGKSTVARGVASALGALYVDSGAMYRGMTWKVLREGADPEDEDAVRRVMGAAKWRFETTAGAVCFRIDGEDPGEEIRGEAVRDNVSYVARVPEVRAFIVDRIRGMRGMGRLVCEGRDIGTVVFPETPWKFYLDADPGERARRRNAELLATESGSSVEAVLFFIVNGYNVFFTRKTAPLQIAPGAFVVDTTHLSLEQVVESILAKLRETA